MRTVIGLFGDEREAKLTIDELSALGARDVSVLSSTGKSYGPLTTYLDRQSATEDPQGIIRALVSMGLSQKDAERYVDGVGRGYTLETATIEDDKAEEALAIMTQHAITREDGGAAARREGEETVLPVLAEELHVGKREVGAGGVRVTTRVEEIPVEEKIALREERVDVERRAVDRPIAPGDKAFRDQTIEVTATSEQPVVEKQARVVEEVVVRKDQNVRTETIRDTVRKTDVDVQKLAAHYRDHFERSYGGDAVFDDYAPAYDYGNSMRANPSYANRDWGSVEPDFRADWEKRNPGTWDRFKSAVRHAWEDVKR